MCMQDLVINRAVTWQPVANLSADGIVSTRVPANPQRVALLYRDSGSSIIAPLSLRVGSVYVTVNGWYDQNAGAYLLRNLVTNDEMRGLFNSDLYIGNNISAVVAMEAVIDPELAAIVQLGYSDLQTTFRRGDGR